MPHESVTRTERECSLGWAEANPALFVQTVKGLQDETPITHWRHFIDLGRKGFVTFIAVRRKEPFADVKAYLAHGRVDGGTYLKEVGYGQVD